MYTFSEVKKQMWVTLQKYDTSFVLKRNNVETGNLKTTTLDVPVHTFWGIFRALKLKMPKKKFV